MRNPASRFTSLLLSACAAFALAATAPAAGKPAALSVEQIIEKHVAARGGLAAWRDLQTLSLSGKLDVGTGDSVQRSVVMSEQGGGAHGRRAERATAAAAAKAPGGQIQVPFRMQIKKPHKSRFEIDFAGKTAVQVYDGQHGWKLRPYLSRDDVEPFTADEAKSEESRTALDDPLIDYAAKGTRIALEGTEAVDGHDAYKLKLTLRNGEVQNVWVDAQSFLDVKVEGIPRRMDGRMHKVFVYQGDFHAEKGLIMPHLYVTSVDGYPGAHRMIVESVTVNPSLDDSRFAKPQASVASAPASPQIPAATTKSVPAKS
jgi:hypothetical protein